MPSLDNLPEDQRAVLALILRRGRSYDQIAQLLSIDHASVRERALAALDGLGPESTQVAPERRGRIGDYLLGQLPDPADRDEARDLLAASPGDRDWARGVAAELAPLAGEHLPEIPGQVKAAPQTAPARSLAAAAPAAVAAPTDPAAAGTDPAAAPIDPAAAGPGERPTQDGDGGAGHGRRSSRLGGMILLSIGVVAVAVVLFFVVGSGGSSRRHHAEATPTTAGSASAASASSTTSSTSSATRAKVVAQINLTPPHTGSKAAGIAEVLDEGTSQGVAIVAQNVPPNSTKPPNAYAVWLYNSPTDAHILGFINPGVGANGRLSTAGALPNNAKRYRRLILTVETTARPKVPGTIILQGAITGL